jgi:hypothetical protein
MRIPVLVLLLVMAGAAGCARCNAPEVPEASAPPAPPPPPPLIKDAGPDVTDARSDASDAAPAGPARHAAKKPVPAPTGGGAGGIKVEGSLQKPDAEKIVRAGFAKLRACSPDAKGRVTFRLTIDARGRVTLGEVVTSTLGGDDAEMCMIRATRDFKFPAAAGESTVTFPMNFGR